MAVTGIDEAELGALMRQTEEATRVFIRGDMERYLELTQHASDFTLFNPFGGEATRYADRRESLLAAAGFFTGGEAEIELVEACASGDLLVLVMIERQHGTVGGLPDQSWSLRVTQVYRRIDGVWKLAHRHADPLVPKIGLERAAAIARS